MRTCYPVQIAGVLVGLLAGCVSNQVAQTVDREDVRAALSVLAADSMLGRRVGTEQAADAAAYIAARLESFGVEPAGEDGFFQHVPMVQRVTGNGMRPALLPSLADLDTVPEGRRVLDVNVVGIIRGSDPELRDEAVVVGAHHDHIGVREVVNGDSIYNGADDDASGVVAVLEIARALASGRAPRRTVIFLFSCAEEVGLLGTRWYMEHPAVPLEQTVADLQVEMIGRPDSLAGGVGRAWLTGYERSTMGDMLGEAGVPIVADPRPEMRFYQRSDNFPFALAGIPAHTLSSFNMHTDYHQPSDDIDKVDFAHMTSVIEAAIQATWLLANGDKPEWHEGGRPERRR